MKAPGAGLRQDGTLTKAAIEQIVVGAVQTVFLVVAGLTRPPEYVPAWMFTEEQVKPASDHFVRWAQTFEPEKLVFMAKFVDPVLGCAAMYSLYSIARLREKEMESATSNMVNHAPAANAATVDAAAAHPNGNGRTPDRSPNARTDSEAGPGLPPSLFC